MKRSPLRRTSPLKRRTAKSPRRKCLLVEAAVAHLAGKHAEVDRLIALSKGREAVRIGEMTFDLPAGLSKARRRAFLDAAEQHVLENGEITIADAQRLLRERYDRVDRIARPVRNRPRQRTKYARRPRDTPRMLWCKTLPCALARPGAPCIELWRGPPDVDACDGPIEAHHAGERGTGQKAPDDTVVPLCKHHHDCLTDRGSRRGVFSGWPRGAVKRWELAMVAVYQHRYAEHVAGRDAAGY
jgi:hypothetical protein